MSKIYFMMIFWLCSMTVQAQSITHAEYFFDTDPGPGNATPITGFSADDTLSISTTISTTGLGQGFHYLVVRVKDSNNRWSHYERRGFYIVEAPVLTSELVAAEYFFDTDPGPGNGTSLSIGTPDDTINVVALIPQSLAGGFHTLVIRVRDQDGHWSHFERRSFYIQPPPIPMQAITEAEYYIDTDPGVGNGIPIPIGGVADTIMPPFSIPIPDTAALGEYFYAIRVRDLEGNWSQYHYDTVIVAITLPPDTSLFADTGLCTKVVNGLDAETIDSEPYSYTLSGATTSSGSGSASGLAFNAGVTIVTYTLDNFPAATASFTVTVLDNEIPNISCPVNISVGADENVCGAVVNYSVLFSDNCPGASILLLSGLASGSTFPTGVTVNTFRSTDTSGNSSTCSFSITVLDDVPPMLTCPVHLTINTDPGVCTASNVILGSPTVSDNCLMDTTMNNGLTTYPLGVTPVTWTATDAIGNTSTCVQNVTVVDNQNPVVTCPANITMSADPGTCTKSVTYAANATDNCSVSGITYSPTSGSTFSVGTTIVTATATDVNGRTGTCTFTVTITDTEDPVITCPANITVNAENGDCIEVVHLFAFATDNCGIPEIIYTPTSGSSFPVGITMVTATATDGGGRTDTCTFSVTVLDDQPPSVSCPANITVNTDSGLCTASNLSLGIPVVNDNCEIAMTSNNGLSMYPVGATQIVWTTTDVNGLTATCTQTVTVVDTEPPVITDCPQNILTTTDPGECSTIVNFSFDGTDNCGLQSITSTPIQSGEEIPLGIHIITILATDVNGNTSTCTFTIEITDDESPQISCPAQINDYADPGVCNAIIFFNVSATDNCPSAPSVVSNPPSGSAFPVGLTIVTSTATDLSGNSQSCTFVVNIEDGEPPTINCPVAITVNADTDLCTASGVLLGAPFTDDNCEVASLTNNGLSTYPLGVTNVIWTVTDIHGHTASCVQSVTVEDGQPPQIICPGDINVFAGPGPMTIVNYDAPIVSDNCPFANMIQTAGLPSGSLFPLGTTVNTFMTTDASGLTASCSFSVTIRKGKVGVNTLAPLAILHVKDSSVLFTSAAMLPSIPDPPPVSGPGGRMMWYSDKGVFRAGHALATEWDENNTGILSFAAGLETRAQGDTSIAMGLDNQATGKGSVAIGSFLEATGENAIAFGALNVASGHTAVALGLLNIAAGDHSLTTGFANTSRGNESFVLGYENNAFGDASIVAGYNNDGNAFASMSIGQYSDTINANRNAWIETEPIFVIGNGLSSGQRNNAMTVLKNGNTGINMKSPLFRLHTVGKTGGNGTFTSGILVQNTGNPAGEAGLSFRNTILPIGRNWMVGINEGLGDLSFAYGSNFSVAGTGLTLDTLKQVGIITTVPQGPLHVRRNSPSGGNFTSSPLSIFESNNNFTFLQFSNPTSMATGILSGNQATFHRSGLIFAADSSLLFSAGGDSTRLKIAKNGNVGIATNLPTAKLDVFGTTQFGTTGTTLQEIIKTTVNIDITSMNNSATSAFFVNVPNASISSTIFISPSQGAPTFPDGLIIASARVSNANTVEIRFVNRSGMVIDPPAMDFFVGVIR